MKFKTRLSVCRNVHDYFSDYVYVTVRAVDKYCDYYNVIKVILDFVHKPIYNSVCNSVKNPVETTLMENV